MKQPKIDIVPLVDVLMVLIIFFLVSMQFYDLKAINVKLPKIETAGSNPLKEQIVIELQSDGICQLNGKKLGTNEIENFLGSVSQLNPELKILIAADEDVALKHVTQIVDSCRKFGLDNFSLQSR